VSSLKQRLKLLDGQARFTDNTTHRVGIDGIIPRHDHSHFTVRHQDVLALPNDHESRLLQRTYCVQVINSGQTRHTGVLLNRRQFEFAQFHLRFRFTPHLKVFSDGAANIFKRFVNVGALGMTSWKFRATDRHTFCVLAQSDEIFSTHASSLAARQPHCQRYSR
jgi:hypothetical protein